jgi:hypothetical protein
VERHLQVVEGYSRGLASYPGTTLLDLARHGTATERGITLGTAVTVAQLAGMVGSGRARVT